MCSSTESQAASSDLSDRGNKNDYDNKGRAGGRRFLNEFLGWLQKINVNYILSLVYFALQYLLVSYSFFLLRT